MEASKEKEEGSWLKMAAYMKDFGEIIKNMVMGDTSTIKEMCIKDNGLMGYPMAKVNA